MTNARVAFAGVLAIAMASAQTAPVLTIDDAVASAMKGNRQVQSAALDVRRAREDTAATKSTRLPQFNTYVLGGQALRSISFTIPQGALGIFPATGPIPATGRTVTQPAQFAALIVGQATQPGTQLFKINLSLTSLRIGEDLAKEKLRQQRLDTAKSVRDLYYQITQTQTQIESAEANEKYLVALQGETEKDLAERAVLKADLLAIRARLSQQRYQLLNLRNTIHTQKESLNRLLGRDLATDFIVEPQPLLAPEEMDPAAAHALALRQRPELDQARLQTQRADTQVRRQRAEYIPDISAGFTYVSVPNVSFLPQNAMIAGFLMQWQPFDWGEKRHKVESLRYQAKEAALSERDTQDHVVIDVDTQMRALAEARMQLDAAAVAQEAQRERLRDVTNQYREKAALLSGLLQQEQAVAQADAAYQSALAGFWRAKAGFDRALGRE